MDITDFMLDLNTALGLGLLIGLERQLGQHPAGMRTSALVCGGAAIYVLLARPFHSPTETARIAAQVISGMGFLGGGVILREGLSVRGLTSAWPSPLWCMAAVGTLCKAPGHAPRGRAGRGGHSDHQPACINPASRWVDQSCGETSF